MNKNIPINIQITALCTHMDKTGDEKEVITI